ncbi:DUF4145 domain-containing protein [Aeromonas dhakensis]|uniref:DUF4145 domain-containing protein n=1 Tax=Aeromonas dhakensis TaxID=196024 RepID=UPI002B47415F|nr:DUF4145 domain-containing protein [Aeromonas dhakensis]
MTSEVLNSSEGRELTVACINCTGKTKHDVVCSVDKSEYAEEVGIAWDESHQIIRCKGCGILSFRRESSNSDDYEPIGDNQFGRTIYEDLYPSRLEKRKGLGSEAVYLPADLRRVYAETNKALDNASPVLAGIGLRAIVETVCKEKAAEGKDLNQKINSLLEKRILTPNGAAILHKVRSLGNKAAHEVKPHTPQQLSLAMEVVEHMIRDVYILPKIVENEFE